MKIFILVTIALITFSKFSQANQGMSNSEVKALVQSLVSNANDVRDFSLLGNSVTEVTKDQTEEGTLYKVTVKQCKAPRCMGGATLTILETGTINGSTGTHVYKTKIERLP